MGALTLPATTTDLVLPNVTVPSGYANYFLLAHQQMSNSGEPLADFLIRQMIYQSVERYTKFIIQQDYEKTIASGQALQQKHGGFVTNIAAEEKVLLGQYGQ